MSEKKLLEKNPMGGVAVPIAIVLVGALIIFGVTKMLSTDRSYRDLVTELESKTFGNRWVAAFELSKVLSAKQVPKEDELWLVEKLEKIYTGAKDPRTKEFVVVALGSLGKESSASVYLDALGSGSKEGKFHALVALSKSELPANFDWSPLFNLLEAEDSGLRHAAIFTLVAKNAPGVEKKIEPILNSTDRNLRFAAATGLLNYRHEKALFVVEEILKLKMENEFYTPNKTRALKFNILNALQRSSWDKLAELVRQYALKDEDLNVVSRTNQVLKGLKY